MKIELVLVASIFISVANYFEMYGFFLRFEGRRFGYPALGYSLHVQLATIARFGTTIAFPIVGYLLDSGAGTRYIVLVPIFSSAIFIFASLFSYRYDKGKVAGFLFRRHMRKAKISVIESNAGHDIAYSAINIGLLSFASYLIINLGIYCSFFLASIFVNYRATIIQMSPIITGVGTLISVVYFDPKISLLLGSGESGSKLINIIFISRNLVMGLVLVSTVLIYFSI